DRLAKLAVLTNNSRDVVGDQAEDVLNDDHLGGAARPAADADRGNRHRLRPPLAQGAWDALQYDGERPRLFEGLRIVEDLLRRLIAAALDPIPTKLVDKGGRQAKVRHHGETHGSELPR